jgi:hypothetical protein
MELGTRTSGLRCQVSGKTRPRSKGRGFFVVEGLEVSAASRPHSIAQNAIEWGTPAVRKNKGLARKNGAFFLVDFV